MVYTSINAASTVCTRCFEKMEILASWWSIFFPPFIVAVGAFNKLPQSQSKSLQELWRCKEFYYCRICIYSLLQYMFGLHLNIFELLYVHIAVPKRCMVRLLNWTHDMQSFPLWILCWFLWEWACAGAWTTRPFLQNTRPFFTEHEEPSLQNTRSFFTEHETLFTEHDESPFYRTREPVLQNTNPPKGSKENVIG